MNFPWLPNFQFVEPVDQSLNVWLSAALVGMGVVWALWLFVDNAVKGKYTLSQSSTGFVTLTIAAVIAIFGIYNIVTVVVLACVAVMIIYLLWLLIIKVLYQFLFVFVLGNVFAKNFWIAASSEKPKPTKQKLEEPEEPKKPKKKVPVGRGEGSY